MSALQELSSFHLAAYLRHYKVGKHRLRSYWRTQQGWVHHTALDALALWFIAETKLDWAQAYPRDPELFKQFQVEVLPALSMANVREMLKAVLPLKQLTPEEAARVVVRHLVNRSRSTSSRLKAQRRNRDPT